MATKVLEAKRKIVQPKPMFDPWVLVRGMLKGRKLTDPLEYQRRARRERRLKI